MHYTRQQFNDLMNSQNGSKIPGQSDQNVYEQSVIQKYEIGSKLCDGQRVFRYAKAGGTLAGFARLLVNTNYVPGATAHEDEDGFEGVPYAAAAIGSPYLDIPDIALRALNYYAGGFLAIFGVTVFHQYLIVGSSVGNGTFVRLYLNTPIKTENVTIAMGITAYVNQYKDVKQAGATNTGFETAIGLNLIPVTSAYWFWLQTNGPAIVTPTGGTWPGGATKLRSVSFNPADGTIQPTTLEDPSAGAQIVGFLLGATVNAYGDLFVQLMLDPQG